MNTAKLKEQARAFEQREQWNSALDIYQRIVREPPEGEDVELGIWNRIGDLHMRLSDAAAAITAYERAIEAYESAGLHNNAIALCNKILRITPDRTPVCLRLGLISAAKGFRADARYHLQRYAEQMRAEGQEDAAREALQQGVASMPPEDEAYGFLAGLLREIFPSAVVPPPTVGETSTRSAALQPEPLPDLVSTSPAEESEPEEDEFASDLEIASLVESADEPADEFEEVEPLAGLETSEPADLEPLADSARTSGVAAEGDEEFGLLDIQFDETEDLQTFDSVAAEADDVEAESLPLLTFEGSQDASTDEPAGEFDIVLQEEGIAPDADPEHPELEAEPTETDEPFPLLGEVEHTTEVGLQSFERFGADAAEDDAEDGADSEPLPLLGTDSVPDLEVESFDSPVTDEIGGEEDRGAEEGDAEDSDPLPLLSFDAGDLETADRSFAEDPAPVEGLEGFGITEDQGFEDLEPEADPAEANAPTEIHGFDSEERVEAAIEPSVEELEESVEEPADVVEEDEAFSPADLADAGRYAEAVEAVRALLAGSPQDADLYQQQVEYAFRAGESAVLVRAYLDLAGYLESSDHPAKARAVYQRVLELDPESVEARRALGQTGEDTAAEGGDGDFVDFGALVLDDLFQGATTRFVVEAEEPSGDEDQDFVEMLAEFRQQVAKNIDADDSASHYDLGVAFKEMGLLDEAISEFQIALRGGSNPLPTLEMLGECFVAKEQFAVASRVFQGAIRLPGASEAELVGVLYWLGRCEEALGHTDRASEAYERVLATDIGFRDAADRLKGLRSSAGTR